MLDNIGSPPGHVHRQTTLRLSRQLLHRPRFCLGDGIEAIARQDIASAMIASCMAKAAPMQTRGPAPNGRYWKRSIRSRFPEWTFDMKASSLSQLGDDAPSTA
jgi:hypothetical protein